MRILCVIDSLGSGGAQRQLVNLAIGFKERGHNITFLVYHTENFFKNSLDNREIPVIAIIESNYIKRLFKMRKFIRNGNYEVVLSFLEAGNFINEVAGLPWRKWKLVVGERSANPKILKSLKLRFYRLFHLFADYIVSNSHENLRLIKRINPLIPKNKLRVVYNIVELPKMKTSNNYDNFKSRRLNILVAASHQYMKNARGLIEAVRLLTEEEKDRIKVDWFGDLRSDDSYKEARKLVDTYSLKNIFDFHNASENIYEEMQKADVIGLFSFYEGLPNVICEGMVLGKPVISSAVSDVPELLAHDRNFLFNPTSIEDIKRVLSFILKLSEEELLEIGKRNGEIGAIYFEKKKIVSEYISLFN